RDVRGVAIVPCAAPPGTVEEHLEAVRRAGLRVVLLHRPAPRPGIQALTVDWEQVGHVAADRVAAAGHRRIARLINDTSDSAGAARAASPETLMELGFTRRLMQLGIPFRPELLVKYPDLSETVETNGVLVRRLGDLLASES